MMNLVQIRRGWDPLELLSEGLSRLLDFDVEAHGLKPRRENRHPLLNVQESADEYRVTVELPGVGREEIALDLTDATLKLSCECRPPKGVDDESYRRQERWFGKWMRELALPERVDPKGVTADMAHGVLTIHLPKVESAKPRRIEIAQSN